MKSVMSHSFAQIPRANIPRSSFNRSHGLKTTFDGGDIIPIFWDEVLPGDTFNLKTTLLARLATPIHPIMDNIFLDTFYFFVPNRLLWENWERFNGAVDEVDDVGTDYTMPVVTTPSGGHSALSIYDYFGLPVGMEDVDPVALHFRAHNKIHNDWFQDKNTREYKTQNIDDGPDTDTDYDIYKRSKRHDYFTSCLPWPQKGDAVTLPLGTTADVYGNGKSLGLTEGTNNVGLYEEVADADIYNSESFYNVDVGTFVGTPSGSVLSTRAIGVVESGESGLYADLSGAVSATVNELRQAFQIQKMLELDARGGTRYTEVLQNHFGVISPDFRLQRSEYLGGGSQRINISQVPQTGPSADSGGDAGTPQGNLAAFGMATGRNGGFVKSFTEHGVIIGYANVRADLTYQQGKNRMWSRETRYDYYWPALAHLGEQAVLNGEIYFTGTATDANVFGYQERFAEYRYKPSQITGIFRSSHPSSLESWHLSYEFSGLPTLNAAFMRDTAEDVIDRAIAVPAQPQIILDAYFDLQCARPMPVYSVPGLVDHF